jgi:hypothetical protein
MTRHQQGLVGAGGVMLTMMAGVAAAAAQLPTAAVIAVIAGTGLLVTLAVRRIVSRR